MSGDTVYIPKMWGGNAQRRADSVSVASSHTFIESEIDMHTDQLMRDIALSYQCSSECKAVISSAFDGARVVVDPQIQHYRIDFDIDSVNLAPRDGNKFRPDVGHGVDSVAVEVASIDAIANVVRERLFGEAEQKLCEGMQDIKTDLKSLFSNPNKIDIHYRNSLVHHSMCTDVYQMALGDPEKSKYATSRAMNAIAYLVRMAVGGAADSSLEEMFADVQLFVVTSPSCEAHAYTAWPMVPVQYDSTDPQSGGGIYCFLFVSAAFIEVSILYVCVVTLWIISLCVCIGGIEQRVRRAPAKSRAMQFVNRRQIAVAYYFHSTEFACVRFW